MSLTRKKTKVSKVLPAPPKAKEDRHFVTALARANGNILRAAEMLGVSRPTLYDLMHRLGIK